MEYKENQKHGGVTFDIDFPLERNGKGNWIKEESFKKHFAFCIGKNIFTRHLLREENKNCVEN